MPFLGAGKVVKCLTEAQGEIVGFGIDKTFTGPMKQIWLD